MLKMESNGYGEEETYSRIKGYMKVTEPIIARERLDL